MMLDGQKQQLLDSIQANVYSKISSRLHIDLNNGTYSVKDAIATAVAEGVKIAIEELMDKTYYQQDLEKDLGLR